MDNREIHDVLEQVADLLEFQGANAFRIRAYRSAARKIKDLPEPISAIHADPDRKLLDIPGVGKDLAGKLATLVETGRLPMLDELLGEIPKSVLSLLRIPGLGPKKAAVLYNELKITTLDQLRAACEEGIVRDLKGFAAKTEETILAGIDLAAQADKRTYWKKADVVAQALLKHMQDTPGVKQFEMAGSYRRGRETIGDLDLLIESDDAEPAMDRFGEFEGVEDVIVRGDTKMSVRLESGLQIDLRVVPAESFGAALQYFTGSKDHNVALRGMAKQRGLKINEWGLFRVAENPDEADVYLAGRTEAEVYAALDLPCFPPELREARQEFEWAAAGQMPELVELDDIRGDLHMHTTESDGKHTLREMIEGARSRGLEYIAITDHSKRVSMANGLDGGRLLKQWAEIESLRSEFDDIQILKGIECDILEKGGMDLPDDVLAEADWVVASIHYGQRQPREQITARILEALVHPHVHCIAHPTGRLINRRERYEVDIEAVFQAAAANKKLLELNANPARLDLDDIHCAGAKRHGVPIVISTDAHSIEGLEVMRYGILQARRAGLMKSNVANTRTWSGFEKLLNR